MSEQFTISDKCSPEQAELFKLYNKLMEEFDLTKEEAEKAFRLALVDAVTMLGSDTQHQIMKHPVLAAQLTSREKDILNNANRIIGESWTCSTKDTRIKLIGMLESITPGKAGRLNGNRSKRFDASLYMKRACC